MQISMILRICEEVGHYRSSDAGDMEIAMVLMAMAGCGGEIDQAIAEESQIVQVMLHPGDKRKE